MGVRHTDAVTIDGVSPAIARNSRGMIQGIRPGPVKARQSPSKPVKVRQNSPQSESGPL